MLKRYMKNKVLMQYKCCWCQHKFEKLVGRTTGKGPQGGHGKIRAVSSQVKCPKCGNFIRTGLKDLEK